MHKTMVLIGFACVFLLGSRRLGSASCTPCTAITNSGECTCSTAVGTGLCPGTYASITVTTGQCTLGSGVVVTGNVTAGPGTILLTSDGAIIDGNVTATDAVAVTMLGTTVGTPCSGGNIKINGTTGGVDLDSNTIAGNVEVKNQAAGFISLKNNAVGSGTCPTNVRLKDNTTTFNLPGTTSDVIVCNDISGNLHCTGNSPAPTDVISSVAFPNAGTSLGQCSFLTTTGTLACP